MSTPRSSWAGLAPRERLALGLGAAALAALLVWLFGVEPLSARAESAARALAAERATTSWLQALPEQPAAASAGQLEPGETPLGVLNQDLRAAGLDGTLKRLAPTGEGRVELGFEAAHWETLAGWLAGLARERGVRVVRAQVEKTTTSGLVNAQLVLAFPGVAEGVP